MRHPIGLWNSIVGYSVILWKHIMVMVSQRNAILMIIFWCDITETLCLLWVSQWAAMGKRHEGIVRNTCDFILIGIENAKMPIFNNRGDKNPCRLSAFTVTVGEKMIP